MKTLKLWNGRWDRGTHIYCAAYSAADLIRMIQEWKGREVRGIAGEIRNYWSPDCWGVQMQDVSPERGIWVGASDALRGGKPVRVWPEQ